VTLQEALATHLLMDDFKKFAELYPAIILELVVSDEEFSLSKREADVAIRITKARPQEHLVGRRILSYNTAVYGSVEYIKDHKITDASSTNNNAGVNWIGWDENVELPQWVKNSEFPNFKVVHQTSHLMAQLAAAKSGLGISMLPCFIADQEPSLQRVPGSQVQTGRDIWLLTHRDLRQTTRVRVFTEFMAEAIRQHTDLIEGRIKNQY
jgi:DNA-binding transcriptional LysR family regulator